MRKTIIALVALVATTLSSNAILTLNSAGTPHTQNFDSLASSGSANTWANNSTLDGWYLFQSPVAVAVSSYGASAGPSTGGFYSLGGSGSSDRALGGVGSSSFSGWIAVAFKNNSDSAFAGFTANWDGEQWRNSAAGLQTMVFEYGFGDTFQTVLHWEHPGGGFDWTSPVTGGSTSSGIGNGDGLVTNVGGTIPSLAWANGETLWLRWVENDDTGNDHALAIDNFSFTALRGTSTVPDAGSSALLLWIPLLGLWIIQRVSLKAKF